VLVIGHGVVRKHDYFEGVSEGVIQFGDAMQFILCHPAPIDDSKQDHPKRKSRSHGNNRCLHARMQIMRNMNFNQPPRHYKFEQSEEERGTDYRKSDSNAALHYERDSPC